MMKICVCVCTYRRPQRIQALLLRLAEQDTAGGLFELAIVVADNDHAESGKAAVLDAATRMSIPVHYCVEPEQNIARARNRALAASSGDFIAFIDDDELPPRDWILQALRACLTWQVDGVLAPVRPLFECEPPRWLLQGGFCERPEHATGHVLSWRDTRTGNVLMHRSWIEAWAEPFTPSYRNGGEDVDFFRRLMARGARFIWCQEAAVFEFVPRERCERRYLLRRALLRGQNERALTTLRAVCTSLLAVPIYTALLPFMLLAGQHRFMQVCIRLCDHAGRIVGVLGLRPLGKRYLGSG
jgi:succinoglycan biosynthesis protein ExoM